MAATSFPILILLLFPSFFYLQRKKKNTPIKVNFSKYLPIPLPRPPLVTILDATYHPPTSPLLFSLSPHSSLSASAKSQTSQPLSWVKRRKRAFRPGSPVYKELVGFLRPFEVRQLTGDCHWAKARRCSTDSLHSPHSSEWRGAGRRKTGGTRAEAQRGVEEQNISGTGRFMYFSPNKAWALLLS